MLELLRIKNLALIQDMELEFDPGLNVLTGESGAGKSFILKALDFILGEKMSASMVRAGEDKAVVEAVFVLDGEEYIIKRELAARTSRSRFYLNDSLSSQDRIQSLRDSLLIYTSQHGQQKLLKPAYHVRILDGFLENPGVLQKKDELLESMNQVLDRKKEIQGRLAELEEKKELLEYQKARIDEVHPEAGEEDDLLARRDEIKSRADLAQDVQKGLDILHSPQGSLLDGIRQLCRIAERMKALDEGYARQAGELENAAAALEDFDRVLRSTRVHDEEAELEKVESRLWELNQLKRKLGRSLDEILDMEREIQEHLSFLDQGRLDLKQLERQEAGLARELDQAAGELNQERRKCAGELASRLEKELQCLGFSEHIRVEFQFSPVEIYPGINEDRPRLLWIPNPGQPAQPLDKIASGGELSRFLLALVGLRSEKGMPTLLFDEVDAGIGGGTLIQVGQRIQELSRNRQILLITHWPQLADLADCHFMVQKEVYSDQTYTLCSRLDAEQSRSELARMAGEGG